MNLVGKMLIAQGGGPTAVINESLVGAILEAKKNPNITHVYGALNGVDGIVNEDFIDLTFETEDNLKCVAKTPSSALRSTRTKPDAAFCERMFEIMRHHDVRYFFYIGGNDSSDTVRIVKEFADKEDYDLVAVHIPKTVDNDLMENDHTPGFASAAKFVAHAFRGINQDNRALQGVYIAVLMGRHAGFLTASSILGKVFDDDGPHLIYLPEVPFNTKKFLEDVDKVYKKHGRCIVAMSEGVADESGEPMVAKLIGSEKDDHGNIQLSGNGALGDLLTDMVKEELGISRVRSDTFGYLQRSFAGVRSEVDAKEAREVGEMAAKFAFHGQSGSVAIKRMANYEVDYQLVDLKKIAAKTRHMDEAFINKEGNGVTKAFIDYMKPLVGKDLPTIARLRAKPVERTFAKKQK